MARLTTHWSKMKARAWCCFILIFCATTYIDDLEISEAEKYPGHAISELTHLRSIEIIWYSSLAFTVESKADNGHTSARMESFHEKLLLCQPPPLPKIRHNLLIFWGDNPAAVAQTVSAVHFLTHFMYWKWQSEWNWEEPSTMTRTNIYLLHT